MFFEKVVERNSIEMTIMKSSLTRRRFYHDYFVVLLVCGGGWFVKAAFLNHPRHPVIIEYHLNKIHPSLIFQKNKCSGSSSGIGKTAVPSWMTTSKHNENEYENDSVSSPEQIEFLENNNETELTDDVTYNDTATTTENTKNKNATTTAVPFSVERPIMVTGNQQVLGIGGTNGLRPDVSKLKRNLVQESVQKYKKEVLMLLGGGSGFIFPLSKKQKRNTIMEEKIAALLDVSSFLYSTLHVYILYLCVFHIYIYIFFFLNQNYGYER